MALSDAREALAARQQSSVRLLTAVTEAEQASDKAVKALNEAKAALAAQPARIKALQVDVQKANKAAESPGPL